MQNYWNNSTQKAFFAFFASLFCYNFAFSQIMTDGVALNVAGKQRMLVERVAKDFVYKSLQIQKEKATKEQLSSTILFEEHLNMLLLYAPNEAIKQKINLVSKGWLAFKDVLGYKTMNQLNAAYVFQESDKMLKLCDDVVNSIVIHVISKKSSLDKTSLRRELIATHTNTSGKMRMLIQRTALYYVCYCNNITQNVHEKELQNTAEFIQFSLDEIKNSPLNDAESNEAIIGIETEWKTLRDSFEKEKTFDFSSKAITPEAMFDLSNRLVAKIDKVTLAYAKMLDNSKNN
jgi:hypothetical protein